MVVSLPASVVVAISRYQGEAQILEGAIGSFVLGAMCGWRALHVLHSRKTLRTYQEILGVRFADVFPRDGYDAARLERADVLQRPNFWKVINGGQLDGRGRINRVIEA